MNRNQAFSLLELMVTIGIIAILTAISTPVYVSYTIKSNVSSALPVLESLKIQASEYYTVNNKFPTSLADISANSYSDSIIASTKVATDTCPAVTGKMGCVQATFSNLLKSTNPLKGKVLSLVAIDSGTVIQWVCKSGDSSGNTIDISYLPKSCQ